LRTTKGKVGICCLSLRAKRGNLIKTNEFLPYEIATSQSSSQ
jgi:hypothetical protein